MKVKRGERIKLIKQIVSKLSKRNWEEIDFTLRQFELPWSPTWNDPDKDGYCIHHVEQGKDDILLELYEYLYGKQYTTASPILEDKPEWKPGYFRIFFSHISADKALVSDIKIRLERYGIDAFVAHEDIRPTKEWIKVIEAALDSCDALVAFLTSDFHKSKWTDQEVGFCVKRRVLIIPVSLGVDPYGFMERYQALKKHRGNPERIADDLFESLIDHDLTAEKMGYGLVTKFENSESFAESRTKVQLLEKIKFWTPDLLRRVESAISKNRQIRESWGVPEKIREIIEKYSK